MIQGGLEEAWPEQVRQALEPFKQGHLIERPPLFYAAHLDHGVWAATRGLAEDGFNSCEAETLVELDPEQGPSYGMITSQTCDVAEERPNPAQPWVQVAPVYACEETSSLLEHDFVVRLEPPDLEGGAWIADLRIEVPIEKSMLVGRKPIEAFPDETGYNALGEILAYRRGRPALHSVFHDLLNVTTREMKNESNSMRNKARRVREEVYRLKLAIEDGTRLRPVAAKLYVVTRTEPSEEAREWFGDWWNRADEVAAGSGLQLLPIQWLMTEKLGIDLERYEGLLDVRNPLWT